MPDVPAEREEDQLHVVFGAGQVGMALAGHLAGLGLPVRAVSRHRPAGLPGGIDWRAADAADPDAASDAAKGAAVVYQCLSAPYTQWPERFPPLQHGVLTAAERTGALLVTLENLYGYGPPGGRPMTEDLPLAATTVKGRTRAAMTREILRLIAAEVGHPVGVRSVPKLAVRALGLVSPMMRALAEMSYEFDASFILDTGKYQSTFGPPGTPTAAAIATTVAWYRNRPKRQD